MRHVMLPHDIGHHTKRSTSSYTLVRRESWRDNAEPVMTAYKLVTVQFKWWEITKQIRQALRCLQKGPYFKDLVCNKDLFGILGP